jgi:hypothetical protein
LTGGEILDFQTTDMFAKWRQGIAFRPALRDAFLSIAPRNAVAGRTPDQLDRMEAALQQIRSRAPKNGHWMAVVARRVRYIRKERRMRDHGQ